MSTLFGYIIFLAPIVIILAILVALFNVVGLALGIVILVLLSR